MKVILVAKKALDAYLINSAALREQFIYLAPFDISGAYKFFKIVFDFLLMITQSTNHEHVGVFCE